VNLALSHETPWPNWKGCCDEPACIHRIRPLVRQPAKPRKTPTLRVSARINASPGGLRSPGRRRDPRAHRGALPSHQNASAASRVMICCTGDTAREIGQWTQIVTVAHPLPPTPPGLSHAVETNDSAAYDCLDNVLIRTSPLDPGRRSDTPDQHRQGVGPEVAETSSPNAIDTPGCTFRSSSGETKKDAVTASVILRGALFPQSIGWLDLGPRRRKVGGPATGRASRHGLTGDFAPVHDSTGTTGGSARREPGPSSRVPVRPLGGGFVTGLQGAGNVQLQPRRPVKQLSRTRSRSRATTGRGPRPVGNLQDVFLPVLLGAINANAPPALSTPPPSHIPATAPHFLLTTELRERLGFKGVVISAYATYRRWRTPTTRGGLRLAPRSRPSTRVVDVVHAAVRLHVLAGGTSPRT